MGLTRRQAECFAFLESRMDNVRQVSLSYEEIKYGLGIRSKSGVHRLIMGLKQRGFIRCLPNHARAIEIVDVSSRRAVLLAPDTLRLVQAYADSTRVGVDTAADTIIRERLGVAA